METLKKRMPGDGNGCIIRSFTPDPRYDGPPPPDRRIGPGTTVLCEGPPDAADGIPYGRGVDPLDLV